MDDTGIPQITQDQADYLNRIYGGNVTAGTDMTALANSYMAMGANQASYGDKVNQGSEDPVLNELVKQGYLNWNQDNSGQSSLQAGQKYQDLINKAYESNPTYDSSHMTWAPASDPLNIGYSSGAYQAPVAPTNGMDIGYNPNQMLFLQPDSVKGWLSGSGKTIGNVDPATGLQLMDFAGVTPQFKMDDAFGKFVGSGGLAMALAAPMFAPLAGAMGAAGSGLFNAAGNAMLSGGQFNPLSLASSVLSNFLPPQVVQMLKYGQMAYGALQNPKGAAINMAEGQIPNLMKYITNNNFLGG